MQKKNGVSLIVLVITIIVMIILAAAIIISLTNSGIINKANEAVAQSNLKQVQQIASLAWAEAYADGKTTAEELDAAVKASLAANKIDTSKYDVLVNESGVNITAKGSGGDEEETLTLHHSYTCLNGVWSEKIMSGETIDENAEIVANFYKTGKKTTVFLDEEDTFEGDEYHLIITGAGTMGEFFTNVNDNVSFNAWNKEIMEFIAKMEQGSYKEGDDLPAMLLVTDLTIGEGITNIPNLAFMTSQFIKNIKLPSTVVDIAQEGIYGIQNITIAGNNPSYTAIDNVWYNKTQTEIIRCSILKSTINIPATVTTIGYIAFEGNTNIKSITIPSSVTSIGQRAFASCSNLEKIEMHNGITTLGRNAFHYCYKLDNVVLPTGITEITPQLFDSCTSLKTIVIPKEIITIENNAFAGCTALTTVNYTGSSTDWANISISSYNENLTNANITYNYTAQ